MLNSQKITEINLSHNHQNEVQMNKFKEARKFC